jgi:VIT1/CCC1 family predicted Fe2+/Mn2+ transporter
VLATTAGLLAFGGTGAFLGGARVWRGALRVLVGGMLAMGASYGIGAAFSAAFGVPVGAA